MSDLTTAARVLAHEQQTVVDVTTTLRLRVQPHTLLLSLAGMAGEHGGVLHAFTAGAADGPRETHAVPDPRDRDAQAELFIELARVVDRTWRQAVDDRTFPQVLLSGTAALDHLAQIAQRLRNNDRVSDDARVLGQRLSYWTDRADVPGQQSVIVGPAALRTHLVTGMSPTQEEHLGAFLEWCAPSPLMPRDATLLERVELAERYATGPARRPEDDRDGLIPALTRHGFATMVGDQDEAALAAVEIGRALQPALRHQMRLLLDTHSILRSLDLPDLPDLATPLDPRTALDRLCAEETRAFASWCAYLALPDHPIATDDSDVAAAYRLARHETAHAAVTAAATLGDPLTREAAILAGAALRARIDRLESRVPGDRPRSWRRTALHATLVDGPGVPRPGETWHLAAPGALPWRVDTVTPGTGGDVRFTLSRAGTTDTKAYRPSTTVDLVPAVPDWDAGRRAANWLRERNATPSPWLPPRPERSVR